MFGPDSWGGSGAASGRGSTTPPLGAFLTAAHELRAPLAWLLGEVESLRAQASGPLNTEQLTITRQIADTCVRMQRIVEDCFAYGRLENGEMSFHADMVDVDALMRELAGAWAPAFEKKGVQLIARAKGTLEAFACDPHKLLRAISILLENALKFTPTSGTTELVWQPCVWARSESRAGANGRRMANAAHFSVRDTGPGIAPENQLEIFEPFVSLSRGDADAIVGIPPGQGDFRRRKGDSDPGLGLGLGLAVARRLVQWHGGKIWVESTLGQGSIFSVILPLHP
ncbi:MAG: sensor histidine kinase [Terriglobales bacterium]